MSDNSAGLSTDAALHRLQQVGPNTMGDEAPHPLVNALAKLWAPVPWMLEVAIVVQLGLGDYAEAGVVAMLLIINAGVSLFQEGRAKNTVNALKSRLAPNAIVRRDGAWATLPAAGLVTDDVLKLTLGAIVPADARLLSEHILLDHP